jgi:hypothetical protein
MSALALSKHATIRMAQRGIRFKDAELIALIGTEVDGGYFVRDRDYEDVERLLKDLAERLRRLIGKRLVLANGQVVTVYHSSKKNTSRLLRRVRDSDF